MVSYSQWEETRERTGGVEKRWVAQGYFCAPICRQNAVPPQKQKVFHDQLRAELMSLLEHYEILECEGIFSKSSTIPTPSGFLTTLLHFLIVEIARWGKRVQ